MTKKVAIIDYESGNVFSVRQALNKIGVTPSVTADHDEIYSSDAVILPGVGAFSPAIERLKASGLDQVIVEVAKKGVPVLGICLGMQLLFESSDEFGQHDGLGLIKGDVTKFSGLDENAKVPQTQWNEIFISDMDTALFKGFDKNPYMYFVHSYYVRPANQAAKIIKTNYCGLDYCCAIEQDNIFAVQFHPERSGEDGLKLMANFCSQIES